MRDPRLERFLFAPVDPRVAGGFRAALAGLMACVFWPQGYGLTPAAAEWSGLAWLHGNVLNAPLSGWLALPLLLGFGIGVAPRVCAGGLLVLFAPRLFLDGVHASGQVLWFTLAALALWGGGGRLSAPRATGPIWPLRIVQLQLSVVYGVNALAKTTPEFLRGDVLVALAALPNFRVDLSDGFLQLGPLALPVALAALAVTAVEYALALGFWIPALRWATASLGLFFHAGLTLVVTIGWLDWACVFLYAAFLLPFEARGGLTSEPPRT